MRIRDISNGVIKSITGNRAINSADTYSIDIMSFVTILEFSL